MTTPTLHLWKHTLEAWSGTSWTGDAGALLTWARWHVDGLYYAADLDAALALATPLRA